MEEETVTNAQDLTPDVKQVNVLGMGGEQGQRPDVRAKVGEAGREGRRGPAIRVRDLRRRPWWRRQRRRWTRPGSSRPRPATVLNQIQRPGLRARFFPFILRGRAVALIRSVGWSF